MDLVKSRVGKKQSAKTWIRRYLCEWKRFFANLLCVLYSGKKCQQNIWIAILGISHLQNNSDFFRPSFSHYIVCSLVFSRCTFFGVFDCLFESISASHRIAMNKLSFFFTFKCVFFCLWNIQYKKQVGVTHKHTQNIFAKQIIDIRKQ